MGNEKATRFAIFLVGIVTTGAQIYGSLSAKSFSVGGDTLHELIDCLPNLVYFVTAWKIPDAAACHGHSHAADKGDMWWGHVQKVLFSFAGFILVVASIWSLLYGLVEPVSFKIVIWGLAGAAANFIQILLLRSTKARSPHQYPWMMRHLKWDFVQSIAVAVAGGLMMVAPLSWIDPLAGLIIGVLMLREGTIAEEIIPQN